MNAGPMIDWPALGKQMLGNAIMAVFAIGCGYLLGTSEMAAEKNRVTNLERQVATNTARLDGRRDYLSDVGNRIEYLCANDPDCERRYGPMRVPQ